MRRIVVWKVLVSIAITGLAAAGARHLSTLDLTAIVVCVSLAGLLVASFDQVADPRSSGEGALAKRVNRELVAVIAYALFALGLSAAIYVVAIRNVDPDGLLKSATEAAVENIKGATSAAVDGIEGASSQAVENIGASAASAELGIEDATGRATLDIEDAADQASKEIDATVRTATRAAEVAESVAREARAVLEAVELDLSDVNQRLDSIETTALWISERLAEHMAGPSAAEELNLPECVQGALVRQGESCTYLGVGTFAVREQGAAFPTSDATMRGEWVQANLVLQGQHHTFQAIEEPDGRWRIYAAGQWQAVEGRDCQVGATIEPGSYCVWRGNPFRVYATNDLVTDREHAVQFTHGYAHLDLQFYFDAYDDQLISVTDDYEDKQGNPVSRKFIAQRDPESDSRAWIIVCAD